MEPNRVEKFISWFSDLISKHKAVLLDGGFASLLEQMGHDLTSELWSAAIVQSDYEAVKLAHKKYLQAGCDIISTCSYQASVPSFMKFYQIGEDDAQALLIKSVQAALDARKQNVEISKQVYVAISMGPYGATLMDGSEYSGNYRFSVSKEFLLTFHRNRIRTIIKHLESQKEEDIILLPETIPCQIEVEALLEVLLLEDIDFPCFLSVSCSNANSLASGESLEATCNVVNDVISREKQKYNRNYSKLRGFGINCTPPQYVTSLLTIAANTIHDQQVKLMCYPNSGETWNAETRAWGPKAYFEELPIEDYKLHHALPIWLNAGATIFGGCCRSYPEDSTAMRKTIDEL